MRTKFGEWVEGCAKGMGISQNELARKLGISPIVFSKYCTGDRDISDKTIEKIAKEMNLDENEKKDLFSSVITDYEIDIIEKAFMSKEKPLDIAIKLRFGDMKEL